MRSDREGGRRLAAPWLACAALLASCGSNLPRPPVVTEADFGFEDPVLGWPPPGWRVESTGGASAKWEVQRGEGSGQVLERAEGGPTGSGDFHLCWTDRVRFGEGRIEVRARADGGAIDQGGGPVWRVQDAGNYYLARYNPLESNFRLYRVVEGKRETLASAENLRVPDGSWFTIRIEQIGARIRCWLDERELLQAEDAVIARPGGVGVWVKADARTSFDDLEVRPLQ